MSAPIILALMTTCFLVLRLSGRACTVCPAGGVFVGALFADVSFAADHSEGASTASTTKRCLQSRFSFWSAN